GVSRFRSHDGRRTTSPNPASQPPGRPPRTLTADSHVPPRGVGEAGRGSTSRECAGISRAQVAERPYRAWRVRREDHADGSDGDVHAGTVVRTAGGLPEPPTGNRPGCRAPGSRWQPPRPWLPARRPASPGGGRLRGSRRSQRVPGAGPGGPSVVAQLAVVGQRGGDGEAGDVGPGIAGEVEQE